MQWREVAVPIFPLHEHQEEDEVCGTIDTRWSHTSSTGFSGGREIAQRPLVARGEVRPLDVWWRRPRVEQENQCALALWSCCRRKRQWGVQERHASWNLQTAGGRSLQESQATTMTQTDCSRGWLGSGQNSTPLVEKSTTPTFHFYTNRWF